LTRWGFQRAHADAEPEKADNGMRPTPQSGASDAER
jgi:hypothetical protein